MTLQTMSKNNLPSMKIEWELDTKIITYGKKYKSYLLKPFITFLIKSVTLLTKLYP